MAADCLSVQMKGAENGGDEAMTAYGASPATAERGLTTDAARYGGKEETASETNYASSKAGIKNNGIVGD